MGKARIMIVEDEWIIANDIKNSLIDLGYMVTSIASSGQDAINQAVAEKPDLVLMDIMLRGEMNGIEAAKVIRGAHGIPIIYLTAYDNQYLVEQAKQTDNYGYLLKPFKDKELHIAIDLALHKENKGRK
ncbi:MAG: response regulator [Proteobacteria bacterium]|nr:response regulator [Pseudomonadota bacterium]MBU1737779.1 response regulator [Pseudomonadota bacterium]